MDPLYEEEILAEPDTPYAITNLFAMLLSWLAENGWCALFGIGLAALVDSYLRPMLWRHQQAREDAEYLKDPDRALSREAAVQRARERQQQALQADSQRAKEEHLQREESKRQARLDALNKYGAGASGQRLGAAQEFQPLSGGASTSTYRPAKRSKCGGGGCGR